MKVRYIVFLVIGVIFLGALPFGVSHAAFETVPVFEDVNDIVDRILCPVARTIFAVLVMLSMIFILFAAYQYVTSGGETEKIRKANKAILYAIIAVFIAFMANVIPRIIIGVFYDSSSGGFGC